MSESPGIAVSLGPAPPVEAIPRPDTPAAPRRLAAQRVLPLRHPGRWIITAVVLVLVAHPGSHRGHREEGRWAGKA
ncbi:hypothetical protein ACFRLW_49700, partial [Streptomyces sp. NPDC056728]